MAGYFTALRSWQTWYQQRINDSTRPYEQQSAKKAAAHADTPTTIHVDTLGRIVLTISHNRVVATGHAFDGTENLVATRLYLDIQGRQRSIRDTGRNSTEPAGRTVMTFQHDTGQTVTHQSSMEAGERWALNDVTGKPIRIWDSRGFQRRLAYDQLRRPAGLFVTDGAGERLAEKTVYGEAQGDTANHRTRVYQMFDAAGVVTAASYDFKGNAGLIRRQLLTDYQHPVDWSQQPTLNAETFAQDTTYDASIDQSRPLPRWQRVPTDL